ncbi:MAG: hypothetical protein M1434_14975 [Chloroflexi bacterium]|nr:hypothetical protein [Chloroflexota bacterium]MCL5276023.1 hypothetical protein [Chloroflexota bacterium]
MIEIGTILTILLILLITCGVIWAGLYYAGLQYRRRYSERAIVISHDLHDLSAYLSTLNQFATQAPREDALPYGPLVMDLKLRLRHAQEAYEGAVAQLQVMQQAEPLIPINRLDQMLAILHQLRAWRRHLFHAGALAVQVGILQNEVGGALQQAETIRLLPLGVAGRVRNVLGATERAARICQTLQRVGVIGGAIERLIATIRQHQSVIDQLPACFKQPSDDTVLSSATPDSTRDAWHTLSSLERPVMDALRRTQEWQTTYDEAAKVIDILQTEQATAKRVLDQLPSSIDTSRHNAEFKELRGRTEAILTAWQSPDIERIADLSDAGMKQILALQQWAVGLMSVHKTYQGLELAVSSNRDLISRIGASMNALSQAQECPVDWVVSMAELEQINGVHGDIGDTNLSRMPARLVTDLDNALDLGLRAQKLESRVQDMAESHDQLVALLANPEFQARDGWFHDAAALHIEAMAFATDNWSDQDGLVTLKSDATTLLKKEQELHPLIANEPLPEDELEQWIMHAGAYLRERRGLRSRLESISRTLNKIGRAEADAQTQVTAAIVEMGRLEQNIAQSIRASAVISVWNETMSLRDDGRHMAEALEDRLTGTVMEKATAVAQWVLECADTLHSLFTAVKAEADNAQHSLMAQVEALSEIAPLDTEPSMLAAQQLLNEVPPRPIGGRNAQDAGNAVQDMGGLVDLANGAFERYTRLVEALDDLEHRVVVQVDPRVNRMDNARAAAIETLKELESLQRRIPNVRPLQVTCSEADQLIDLYNQAEGGLQDMTANARTVKSVVSRLDGLIQQFQHIANHGAGAQADIENDLARLQNVWHEYNQWVRQLKRYRDLQARSDTAMIEELNARLADIDQHFVDIQRRYKGRPLPLDSACRELEMLLNDTGHDIEVPRDNGVEVITMQTILSA